MTSGIRQAFPYDFLSNEEYECYKERLPLYFAQVSLWAYHMEDGGLAGCGLSRTAMAKTSLCCSLCMKTNKI